MKKGLAYKGPCIFKGALYDLGRYPGLKKGDNHIEGDLYEISDDTLLAELDEYESHDNYDPSIPGFIRKPLNLIEPDVSAWIYFYEGNVTDKSLLKTNHWIEPA